MTALFAQQFKSVIVPKPAARMSQLWANRPTLYQSDKPATAWRTILGLESTNPLIAVGLNPSYATDLKSDRTISRIKEYAIWHGFDGYIMLNLSAQRTTYPIHLTPKLDAGLHRENMDMVAKTFDLYPQLHILAVWGEKINFRSYLKDSLQEILSLASSKPTTWLQIGPTTTKSGHPFHPSRGEYQPLYHFDIKVYFAANFR